MKRYGQLNMKPIFKEAADLMDSPSVLLMDRTWVLVVPPQTLLIRIHQFLLAQSQTLLIILLDLPCVSGPGAVAVV